MRPMPWWLLIAHLTAGVAHAQTANDLQIRLVPYTSSTDGGEKALGGSRSTGPLVIGKPTASWFSVGEACESFSISSGKHITDRATAAWRIDVTPTRVVRDAVTFQLRWQSAIRRMQGTRIFVEFDDAVWPAKEIELTLRPGESWPVDDRNIPDYACGRASIRVSVEPYPQESNERRLVGVDLWLVERLANGTETPRSEPISVRGLPNRSIAFYFDSLVEANVTLDIYGTITPRLESGVLAMSIETRSRWAPGSTRYSGPQQSITSEIQMKPAETVEMRLPPLQPVLGDDGGPFAKRSFSIRIRARQLR